MSGQTFEIGLVGAGAISAGAYTGGVIDFTVQALDCWYGAKSAGGAVPPHDVKLSVFSGASAGSITAALATGLLASEQPPVTSVEQGRANQGKNKLFDSWVERIDISSLLETKDLGDKESPVVSLLDSTVLMDIANSGLDVAPRSERRPYLGENFELLLTVTNLRGVPYAFEVTGQHPETYDMSLHADYMHFRINDTGANGLPDRYTMAWKEFGESSTAKEQLKLAALASGAFPVGLAPRNLRHVIPGPGKPDWYSARTWPVPTPHTADPHQCVTHACIPAKWGKVPDEGLPFEFQCVDGGVMNNEPFELARKHLAGPQGRNSRDGERADKAVLLIDPFPSEATFAQDYQAAPDLAKIALRLFDALKNQARFKPEELVLAADEDVYSRFMIAPSREGGAYPIACGALGGFGGFLHRSFREHDYFLGRRNAQKFLRDHFVLPETNPLFAAWTEDMKAAHRASGHGNAERYLPIIPLVGEARAECGQIAWPRYTGADLARLEKQLARRVDVVVDRLVNQYFRSNHKVVQWIAGWVLARKKKDIVDFAREKVAGELRKMGLMN